MSTPVRTTPRPIPTIALDGIPRGDRNAAEAWLREALAGPRRIVPAGARPPGADGCDDADAAFGTLAVCAAYRTWVDPRCVLLDLAGILAEHEPGRHGPSDAGAAPHLADALIGWLPDGDDPSATVPGAADPRHAAALHTALAAFLARDRDLHAIPLTAACQDLVDAAGSAQPGAAYRAVLALRDIVRPPPTAAGTAPGAAAPMGERAPAAAPAGRRGATIARLEARMGQLAPDASDAPDAGRVIGWIEARLAHLRWAGQCDGLGHGDASRPA